MARNPSIDLHVHSTYSDGRLTPDELAARARLNRVFALAITDHDSMSGAAEKRAACGRHGVECIDGVEISCEFDGREVHILSLFVNPDSEWVGRIGEISKFRQERMLRMLDKLTGLGIRMSLADLPRLPGGVYGRPHLARALVEKGVVKSVNEAFARYLYDGGPVYIPNRRLPVAEGIDLAKRLGGIAVIAHPGVSGHIRAIAALADMGLDGVEAYHPRHGGGVIAELIRFCMKRGLLISGGSDFHSPGDGSDIGSAKVPSDLLESLRLKAEERKG